MDKVTHKVRREQWTNIIKECLSSGMNKTAWCREHGISDKSFFYWQRRLREEAYISAVEPSCPPAVQDPAGSTTRSIDFVELKASDQPAVCVESFQTDVIIRKGSFSIELSNTASPELIRLIGGLLHAE